MRRKLAMTVAVIFVLVSFFSLTWLPGQALAKPIKLSYANFPPAPTFPCVQMEDWKKKIDDHRMSEHQSKFRCHVCGRPSSGPARGPFIEEYSVSGQRIFKKYLMEANWEKPANFEKCEICNNWTSDNICVHTLGFTSSDSTNFLI